MPKTTLDMSGIKKLGQSRKITFTKSTSSGDLQRKLEEKFPFLKEASGRFYCAKAVENRSKLDFCGDRCVWSGAFINKNITGNSALYIYSEEEKEGDSGHYSSDSDLSVAPVYGNCLVTAASQGCKRFQSEPCSAAEGLHVTDKETLRAVESQKCGTVIESDKNYTFCGQLEDVKISSVPQAIQLQDVKTCSATQVTEKEASVCALTVEREQHQCSVLIAPEAKKEQIQDFGQLSTDLMQSGEHFILSPVCSNRSDVTKIVPMTLPPALQPTLPTGDLPEQINSSTLASHLRSLQISSRDTEIQKSYDQASIETFTAKGSQSAQQLRQPQYPKTQVPANEASVSALTKDNQQNTSGTIGAFDDQIIELLASFECEANSSAQNLMDVERREEWLKQYDYEVVINPKESPLQGGAPCIFTFKPELPSDVDVKASFGNIEPIILVKTILGYICKIPASPKMTPEVIKVWLISTTTGEILAETSLEYYRVLYVRKNLGGKPGACGSGRREDGGNDGGASGGGASGGRASGGRSSGGGSSGEGAGGSGVSGGGNGGTGAGGCGSYGGGATGCQYRIEASQLGSDVVSKLCELIQKCSVGIQRQEPSATQNKACTEAEEDLEDDQLLCTQESNENYFADTEDCSSVSSETDSALSDSESWDESLSDSPLSFPWVNSRSSKSQEAILETESTQHSCEAVYSKLNVSHEIQELMTEGFTSEDSIGNNNYVGSGVCHKWNTSLPESKKTEENCEKDDHNKMQDSSQEWAFFSEGRTSHIQLASHDNTPLLCLDALDLIVENEESQYQDNELFEAPHAENAKPKDSESILSVTSNQQSATHAGPTTQSQAAQSPVSNPLWNGDSQLNMAPPQCSDEEIHSGQEWEESGEGLASWLDLCENEDAGKNEHSRWEMSSIEPNKTDGGVEKYVSDSEEDLSREQGLFSEQGNSHVHLSLPDYTSVRSRCSFAGRFIMFHKDPPLFQREFDEILCGKDTPLIEAARNGHTDIVRLLIENGADVNKEEMIFGHTPLTEAVNNGHTDIAKLLIQNGADVNKEVGIFGHTPLTKAGRKGHTDIAKLLIHNGAISNMEEWVLWKHKWYMSAIKIKLLIKILRRKFEADARDTKLSLERELDVQLRGKKIASLPKRPGKKLKTQTEMTSPRDIVEGECGKDRMTDVELGLNCLHLSPRCVQFKPFIMEESPGDSSIMHHDFKTINKRIDRVTLTDVGNAKQDYCVVVEKAITHPSGATIIIYGRKINEEGSGVGEAFRLATKDLKHTWVDEEVIAENVQIGSVVKYVQVGDKFLFQGNTKRPRWNMDKIFLDLSRADGAHRGFGDAFLNSKILAEDSYQDCTPKETSCFISLKCGVVENDRISVITELGELFNLKLNCRDAILPLSPSTLELSHEEDNKDAVDSAVVEMEEPLLISGVDGLSKPSYPVLGEGLNLRDEPKETSVEVDNPEADPVEKDDENGKAF